MAKSLFIYKKISKMSFKLITLVGLIFKKIEFWAPFRAEGHQNLTKTPIDLKMTTADIGEFTITV